MMLLWIPLLFFTETLNTASHVFYFGPAGGSAGQCTGGCLTQERRGSHRWLFNELIFQSHVKTVKQINVQTFIRGHSEGAHVCSVTFMYK